MKFRIVDKFIVGKFLSSYFFVMGILLLVIGVIQITEKNQKIIENNLSFMDMLWYMLDFFPYVGNMITPITTFIAVVFITAKMAGHSEIIALLSSGISFRRLMRSYLYGAIVIAIINFIFTGWIIPNSNKDRIAFEIQYFENPYHFSDRNIHIKVAPESYFYLEQYNNQSKVGYKLTLETIRDQKLLAKLSAQRIEWNEDSGKWEIRRWELREFDGFNEHFSSGDELDTMINITPKDFDNDWRLFETLTINELNEHIALLKSRGSEDVIVYEVEKQVRYASPFTVILLTFIGLFVSARKARGGTGFQIALGFLISFIYILFFWFSKTMAEAGGLPPALAIWIPNIIFSAIGFLLYKTVPR
jgi:lipopolysaccharide export system permease protein